MLVERTPEEMVEPNTADGNADAEVWYELVEGEVEELDVDSSNVLEDNVPVVKVSKAEEVGVTELAASDATETADDRIEPTWV